jgi:hypothetical protein
MALHISLGTGCALFIRWTRIPSICPRASVSENR